MRWQYQARSEPTPFTTPPSDGWQGSAEPPVSNWRRAALYAVAAIAPAIFVDPWILTQPEAVSVDKSSVQYADQVSRKLRRPALQPSTFFSETPVPLAGDVSWFVPLSEPVRVPPRLAASLQPATFDDSDALTRAEETTPDRWRGAYPDSARGYRRKPHLQPSTFDDPWILTQPEATTPDRWRVQHPDYLRRHSYRAQFAPAVFVDVTPVAAPTDLAHIGWHSPLGEPVRGRPPFAAAHQQAIVIEPQSLTQPEQVSLDRWGARYADRIASRRRAPHLEPAHAFVAIVVAPAPSLDWLVPFSEPVRQHPPFSAARQQAVVIDPQPEQVALHQWETRYADSTASKLRAAHFDPAYIFVAIVAPDVPSIDWLVPLSEPKQQSRTFSAAQQQALVLDPRSLTQPETVSVDRWYTPNIDFARSRLYVAHMMPAAVWLAQPTPSGVLLPDFEIGTTENLMARYTTESLLPEYTTTSLQPRLTTDPLF